MFSSNTSQVSEDRLYVEDVFSTYLYTGAGGANVTVNNGIDLAGKGGLVWIKLRSAAQNHFLLDTARGNYVLNSNLTNAQGSAVFTTSSTGFTSDWGTTNGGTYASWTFRKAPKFFDVVTWTGNGVSIRNFTHSLGVAPGFILVKRTDSSSDWFAYHRSRGAQTLVLNSTAAAGATYFDAITNVSSIAFGVGPDDGASGPTSLNVNGATYVAYLFAHDATSDGIIQCGSFTTDSNGNFANQNLGWEPQWILYKSSSGTGSWEMIDNMRGLPVSTAPKQLRANTTQAEFDGNIIALTPTGFQCTANQLSPNTTYVYIAIRRGPMRTPTTGTSVLGIVSRNGTGANASISAGITTDLAITKVRGYNTGTANYAFGWWDRLRGANNVLQSNATNADNTTFTDALIGFDNQLGVRVGPEANSVFVNRADGTLDGIFINYFFRRAPGFFDAVCYTGTGSARTVSHNLGVAPELMIVKSRVGANSAWRVYAAPLGNATQMRLETTAAASSATIGGEPLWNNTTPTATVFSLGSSAEVNNSGVTWVAYLFASCPGVSKVGSYTGNGSSQTINCGFAAGARFVMIKRTDSTGDWYVWDTARGIVAGNDPYMWLNGTALDQTGNDTLDPDSSGFVVNQVSATNINVSSATYIYLAVA